MRLYRALSVAPLFLAILGFSCGEQEPTLPGNVLEARKLPAEIQKDASDAVAAVNAFAIDVYKALPRTEPNAIFSPFSMSIAFAMVEAGARGETEAEIAKVFHYSADPGRLHPAFRALLGSLETGAGFGGYRLNIANRLWGQEGDAFLPEFLRVTREEYGAEMARVDFRHDPEVCRAQVNRWVEDRTEKRIKDLMPQGSIDASTSLVLANAVYFKGTWKARFDPARTQSLPFHVTADEDIPVPTMHQYGVFAFAVLSGAAVLELPYTGEDMAMVILLPERVDGLPELEAQLSVENLGAWLGALQEKELDVFLPRFEITSSFDLKKVLPAMGMPAAFTAGDADFSGIDGTQSLFIQAAMHKGFIKVDEDGTEAAAATGISSGPTSVPPGFRADHPFVYFIRDKVTGCILFMGRVDRPA